MSAMTGPRSSWLPANKNPAVLRRWQQERQASTSLNVAINPITRGEGGGTMGSGLGGITETVSNQTKTAALSGFKGAGVAAGITGVATGAIADHLGASNPVNIGVNAAAKGFFKSVPGVIGNIVNAKFGVDPTAAKISIYGGSALARVNPAIGYATQIFGGLAIDKAMDGMGIREYESFKDQIETSKPKTIKGYFDARKDIAIGSRNLNADRDGWGKDIDTGYGNIDHHGGGRPTGVLAKNKGVWGRDGEDTSLGDGGGDGFGGTSNGGNSGGLGGSNQGGGDHDGGHGSRGGR